MCKNPEILDSLMYSKYDRDITCLRERNAGFPHLFTIKANHDLDGILEPNLPWLTK